MWQSVHIEDRSDSIRWLPSPNRPRRQRRSGADQARCNHSGNDCHYREQEGERASERARLNETRGTTKPTTCLGLNRWRRTHRIGLHCDCVSAWSHWPTNFNHDSSLSVWYLFWFLFLSFKFYYAWPRLVTECLWSSVQLLLMGYQSGKVQGCWKDPVTSEENDVKRCSITEVCPWCRTSETQGYGLIKIETTSSRH